MSKRLDSILQYYFINRKLQSKFPDANDYVYLSSVFPEKFVGSDKIIPVKYDSHGLIEKIFEEKDCDGLLQTDIIPVEYHSSYAAGIADLIKEIIESNTEFFKVFLGSFERIVVDSTDDFGENIFGVDNFVDDFSYTLEDFLNEILDNYAVSEEYRELLVSKISSVLRDNESKVNINYRFYLNLCGDEQVDFSCLMNLFLMEHEYECLKTLLFSGNTTIARDVYIEKNCFRIINSFLESPDYVPSFLVKHIDILNEAMKRNSVEVLGITSRGNYENLKIDRSSTLRLVRAILKEFDSSGEFNRLFDDGLSKNEIMLWSLNEVDNEEKKLKSTCLCKEKKNQVCVSITMTETILDTVSLVYEFMRYYTSRMKRSIKADEDYLSEVIPIYYGTKACDWLVKYGVAANGLVGKLIFRKFNSNDYSETVKLFNLLYRKNKFGEITSENIKDSTCSSEDDKKYAVECAETLLKAPRLHCDAEVISLALGTYLAEEARSSEMDQKMMFVATNFSDNKVSVDDMMRVITEGSSRALRDEQKNVIQYVKIKTTPVNETFLIAS